MSGLTLLIGTALWIFTRIVFLAFSPIPARAACTVGISCHPAFIQPRLDRVLQSIVEGRHHHTKKALTMVKACCCDYELSVAGKMDHPKSHWQLCGTAVAALLAAEPCLLHDCGGVWLGAGRRDSIDSGGYHQGYSDNNPRTLICPKTCFKISHCILLQAWSDWQMLIDIEYTYLQIVSQPSFPVTGKGHQGAVGRDRCRI